MFGREFSKDKIIIKTAEDKEKERKINLEKRRCPVCNEDPYTGELLVSLCGTTDGEYNYVTCSHCNTDYKYKI